MANLSMINQKNKASGEMEVNDCILETPYHPKAVKQAVLSYLASRRSGTHSAKTRSEVSFSNKKLYRQKGTGNARSGSAKSPLRRHGGVVFGPSPRDHSFRMNKKFRKLALFSALSEKFRRNEVMVLDQLELSDHKTRNLKKILDALDASKVLIVSEDVSDNLKLASRNLQEAHVVKQRSLNVYELMRFPKVIFVKEGLEAFDSRLNT